MLRSALLFFATLSFLTAQPAMARDFAVGSCNPRLTSFSTISVAVSSVPPGSAIFVCPGIYPEQVVITQPLTLQGVTSAGQDAAIVTVPPAGFGANATSIFGEPVAAQILVQTRGPVKIVNLSVDGTGSDIGSPTWVAGIYYASGSSGAVSRARTSGQMNSGLGAGIWVENDGISHQSVDIGDSSVHDVSNTGIFVAQNGSTPTLSAQVHDNTVSLSTGFLGIGMSGVAGTVNRNDVNSSLFGIVDVGSHVSLSSNDVRLSFAGIVLQGGGHVNSNLISNSGVGVLFFGAGGNVEENRITASSQVAIEFGCLAGSAKNNVISDAPVGLDQETAVFDGSNHFDNTVTISTLCATPLAAATTLQGASVMAAPSTDSIWQWRTPGSPLGAAH